MYNGLLHAHSGLRYFVIILLLMVIVQSLMGWIKKGKFTSYHKKIAIISMVFLHVQFILGFVLFFVSPKVIFDPQLFGGLLVRFYTLEHPLLMLLAILIITLGQVKSKSYSNYVSHKRLFVANLIGLVLIFLSIPWPFREQLGAAWF